MNSTSSQGWRSLSSFPFGQGLIYSVIARDYNSRFWPEDHIYLRVSWFYQNELSCTIDVVWFVYYLNVNGWLFVSEYVSPSNFLHKPRLSPWSMLFRQFLQTYRTLVKSFQADITNKLTRLETRSYDWKRQCSRLSAIHCISIELLLPNNLYFL